MQKNTSSLHYMLMTYRLDMLWLPAAFWALFLIMAWIMRGEPMGFNMVKAYFGAALPLVCGILGAYAVLEDPALELQFATPRPAWRMLLERLGAILVLAAGFALAFQVVVALLGYDLAPLGSLAARQLAWLVPTLTMTALGCAVSFALRQSVAGSAMVGMVWIFQVLVRDWFLGDPWAQYLLLLMGAVYPENPAVRTNQAALLLLSALLLVGAWLLLRRQERYL